MLSCHKTGLRTRLVSVLPIVSLLAATALLFSGCVGFQALSRTALATAEEHRLVEMTNTIPRCIEAPLRAAVIFEAGSSAVTIDGVPVAETEWTPFADGRRFVTRPALAVPGIGGCEGPRVVWADGVPEDAEALRLYFEFVGGLIIFSSCERYNHIIEPGVTHQCVVATRGFLFADDFETGNLSAWSDVVGAAP